MKAAVSSYCFDSRFVTYCIFQHLTSKQNIWIWLSWKALGTHDHLRVNSSRAKEKMVLKRSIFSHFTTLMWRKIIFLSSWRRKVTFVKCMKPEGGKVSCVWAQFGVSSIKWKTTIFINFYVKSENFSLISKVRR